MGGHRDTHEKPRADLGGITNTSRLRRAVAATGALAVITTGPIITGPPAFAAQPDPADPTSTQQFAAITAAAAASFNVRPAAVAEQGMGSNPVLEQIAERATRKPAAARSGTRAAVRAKATRRTAKVVHHRPSTTGAGRHRAAPAPRIKVVAAVHHTVARKTSTSKKATIHTVAARTGMSRVVAYARAQVGDSYVHGAAGPNAFDCSGLVLKAYQQIGVNLPHSSGAIAARARTISQSQARPGDIVVGPGHVGIYMGGGKMIDAGNSRVGVVYRSMFSGLHVERLS